VNSFFQSGLGVYPQIFPLDSILMTPTLSADWQYLPGKLTLSVLKVWYGLPALGTISREPPQPSQ